MVAALAGLESPGLISIGPRSLPLSVHSPPSAVKRLSVCATRARACPRRGVRARLRPNLDGVLRRVRRPGIPAAARGGTWRGPTRAAASRDGGAQRVADRRNAREGARLLLTTLSHCALSLRSTLPSCSSSRPVVDAPSARRSNVAVAQRSGPRGDGSRASCALTSRHAQAVSVKSSRSLARVPRGGRRARGVAATSRRAAATGTSARTSTPTARRATASSRGPSRRARGAAGRRRSSPTTRRSCSCSSARRARATTPPPASTTRARAASSGGARSCSRRGGSMGEWRDLDARIAVRHALRRATPKRAATSRVADTTAGARHPRRGPPRSGEVHASSSPAATVAGALDFVRTFRSSPQ